MGTLWIVLQPGSFDDRALVSIDGVSVLDLLPPRQPGAAVSRSFEIPSGDHFVQVEIPTRAFRQNARFQLADKATVLIRGADAPSIEVTEGRLLHGL